MKTGKSLIELATELQRQSESRKDYHAPQGALVAQLAVDPADETRTEFVALAGLNGAPVQPTAFAHKQIADDLGIPTKYYERMLVDRPRLLVENVNTWLQAEPKRTRLVRTLDGKARAWLSGSYRPLDNFELAESVLPVLSEMGTQVESLELTETRLYIKATYPALQTEIEGSRTKGDIVRAGIVISNSEVGNGALRIEPLIFRLICLNGMIAADASMKKYHLGQRASFDEAVREVLTDRTKQADDVAFWMKVRDVVRASFNVDLFKALADRLSKATQDVIVSDDLPKVVDVTVKRLALPEAVGGGLLKALASGGDFSRFGLLNAITSLANTQVDYEVATVLERAGGQVLELKPQDWKVISEGRAQA